MSRKIIHPNCSELVTHLDITDFDEIKETLKEVEKITGWKVGVLTHVPMSFLFPFAEDFLYNELFIPLDIDTEIIHDVDESYDYREEIIAARLDPNKYPHLIKECLKDDWYMVVLYNEKTGAYLRIALGDGYCSRECLTFKAEQHCVERDFIALAKIIEHYDSIWHTHDGGSPNAFEEWCVENGYRHILGNFDY